MRAPLAPTECSIRGGVAAVAFTLGGLMEPYGESCEDAAGAMPGRVRDGSARAACLRSAAAPFRGKAM